MTINESVNMRVLQPHLVVYLVENHQLMCTTLLSIMDTSLSYCQNMYNSVMPTKFLIAFLIAFDAAGRRREWR